MSESLAVTHDPFKDQNSLGIYTKLQNPAGDLAALRVERFALQSASRELLNKFFRVDKKNITQKKFRVAQCLRLPLENSVKIKSKNNVAHYSGLNVCGSVWTCPVCASKITEGRRSELNDALDYWKEQGGSVVLVTTTIPHRRNEKLADILAKVQRARVTWRNRKGFKKTTRDFGVVGTIRSLEITYGVNGWHPHFHELYFYKPCPLLRKETIFNDNSSHNQRLLQAELSNQWRSACKAEGLPLPSVSFGLDVRNGDFAADYVAKFGRSTSSKWGVDHELTKGHIKQSRGGLSPFDLLRSFVSDGDCSPRSPSQYFIEFAFSTFGRSMLHWSRGLKSILRVPERSDQELAERVDTETVHLGNLTLLEWRFILGRNLQGIILEYANIGGMETVKDYLKIQRGKHG